MQNKEGEIAIQTVAMPPDTNANGDIFGGWLLAQMDLASGILAKKHSKSRVVTVAVESMSFISPVHVGDIVTCYAKLLKQGRTSMTIQIDVWATNPEEEEQHKVTTGVFVSVAIDETGKPKAYPKSNL